MAVYFYYLLRRRWRWNSKWRLRGGEAPSEWPPQPPELPPTRPHPRTFCFSRDRSGVRLDGGKLEMTSAPR